MRLARLLPFGDVVPKMRDKGRFFSQYRSAAFLQELGSYFNDGKGCMKDKCRGFRPSTSLSATHGSYKCDGVPTG